MFGSKPKEYEKAEQSVASKIQNERIKQLKSEMLKQSRPAQAIIDSGKQFTKQGKQVDFSETQRMLQSMFGGSQGTFWNLPDSTTQVKINHDLNPSARGDDGEGTAQLFGMKKKPVVKDNSTKNLFFGG